MADSAARRTTTPRPPRCSRASGSRTNRDDIYRADDTHLELVFEKRTLHVDTASGKVVEEGQDPRFFLRLANWLHLNRGKKAWTIIADGYAVLAAIPGPLGPVHDPGAQGSARTRGRRGPARRERAHRVRDALRWTERQARNSGAAGDRTAASDPRRVKTTLLALDRVIATT